MCNPLADFALSYPDKFHTLLVSHGHIFKWDNPLQPIMKNNHTVTTLNAVRIFIAMDHLLPIQQGLSDKD